MSSSKISASGVAAGRLSTMQRHLSSTSSNGKQVERMTVFGAGLMGAGIAQVGAQNGLKVCCLGLKVMKYQLNEIGSVVGCDGSSSPVGPFPRPSVLNSGVAGEFGSDPDIQKWSQHHHQVSIPSSKES
jgi:hypothetical protein